MKVTAVFLMCLFIKMSFSVNLCEECVCKDDKLTCDGYDIELNHENIPPNIKNVVLNEGKISNQVKETTSNSPTNVERIEFSRCNLKDLKSLKMFKNLNDLNITQSVINLNLDLAGIRIESLDLSQCGLSLTNKSALINFFKQTPKLEFLSLVGNNFTEIPEDLFAPLTELTSLELDSCSIKTISPLLHFNKLVNFDVTKNNIIFLPVNLLQNSEETLENFEIGDNPIVSLNINPNNFKRLGLIELADTNLICDCKWINNVDMQIVSPPDVICRNETTKDNKISTNITIENYQKFVCQAKHTAIEESNKSVVVVVALLLVLLILAVFGFFGHKLLQVHRRRSREKQQVKYSAVYKDTVEPSVPTSRTTIETKA